MFPDDTESQEQIGEWPFLEKHANCVCPKAISCVSSRHNTSCQKLFTLAYASAGYGESFGRAMFAQFLKGDRCENLVPLLVKDLCDKVNRLAPESSSDKPPCFGCKTTRHGLNGIFGSYERIHPSVDEKQLAKHASDPSTMMPTILPERISTEELSEEDRAWIRLIESGVLNEEDWGSMVRQSDSDF